MSKSESRKTRTRGIAALPVWWAALEALAAKQGIHKSELVRRAVSAYVRTLHAKGHAL